VEVPAFLYGTAWKKERTRGLVTQALAAGFRGIDTANQRRHYFEPEVGAALAESEVPRDELFLQTKYTYVEGQGPAVEHLPYDPRAPIAEQVRQSFESSLEHLRVERVDGYLLHGPRARFGLSQDDAEAWRAMEALHAEGRARLIGASNISAEQLEALLDLAEVPPALVQNRCFARTGWDRDVRAICRREGIGYQGFSLLTANLPEITGPGVRAIAERHGATIPQVVFRFAREAGMIPLTGTTDPEHMREDLAVLEELELSEDEVAAIEAVGG
jgi:diketogulonate reductase-like aldo/keto reductase